MKYVVTPAPHKYSSRSTIDLYISVMLFLAICVAMTMLENALATLIVFATCFAPCVIFDYLLKCLKEKSIATPSFSSFVTGLILTCIMPVNAPWYFGIIAATVAVFSKYIFGGDGNNLLNPAALGRCVVGCLSSGFSFDYFGAEKTVLGHILDGTKSALNLENMIIGKTVGAIGTTFIITILVAMVIFIIFGIINWESVVSALIGFVTLVWILMGYENILPMLLAGSLLFVVVFMLSDPQTSPYNFSARCLNSLLFGVLAAIMMKNNILGETAVFLALLIVNFTAPIFDRFVSLFHRGVRR